ncbi:MAG TPA: dihydrolipoamide acetyltransferase family protein, partial [Candidatus Bathyarchaeia archaeon]|nr:dihydrolipoamide acetyltransferase family protein [Candidatus Bathyarchaeia archaeon]
GRIVAWHKRVGDPVAAGEVLFEVETDKATMEVESPTAGTLRRILYPADATAPVATVIALITETADEPIPAESVAAQPPKPSLPAAAQPATGPGSRGGRGPSEALPLTGSPDGERVRSSPAARKRAQELGVDIGSITGSGPGGRVTLEDVDAAPSRASPPAFSKEKREPLSRMRRAIAERMTKSVREQPQFSISRDVDMTAANEKRKAAGASYTDAIVAAAAKALRDHPRLRSRLEGGELVTSDAANVGLAIALEDGLLVAVIRDADRKDLRELAAERERLEGHARAGKLAEHELTGSVLTVSNLGTMGVDRFTAIVNPPEAAILAVGRVADRVVARDGAPAVRPIATLTLSVDHRVADGATAARYLSAVAERIELADL